MWNRENWNTNLVEERVVMLPTLELALFDSFLSAMIVCVLIPSRGGVTTHSYHIFLCLQTNNCLCPPKYRMNIDPPNWKPPPFIALILTWRKKSFPPPPHPPPPFNAPLMRRSGSLTSFCRQKKKIINGEPPAISRFSIEFTHFPKAWRQHIH